MVGEDAWRAVVVIAAATDVLGESAVLRGGKAGCMGYHAMPDTARLLLSWYPHGPHTLSLTGGLVRGGPCRWPTGHTACGQLEVTLACCC